MKQAAGEAWDSYSPEFKAKYGNDKKRFLDEYFSSESARFEDSFKRNMGDDYIDPATGLRKGAIASPDFTDDAIKKARTNALQRMQLGKNQKNSFSAGTLGGFDVSKPVLGGY